MHRLFLHQCTFTIHRPRVNSISQWWGQCREGGTHINMKPIGYTLSIAHCILLKLNFLLSRIGTEFKSMSHPVCLLHKTRAVFCIHKEKVQSPFSKWCVSGPGWKNNVTARVLWNTKLTGVQQDWKFSFPGTEELRGSLKEDYQIFPLFIKYPMDLFFQKFPLH